MAELKDDETRLAKFGALSPERKAAIRAAQQEELNSLTTKYYILADVIVLGIAGMIGGLIGYQFIGISFQAKGWPGILAFMATSLIGSSLR